MANRKRKQWKAVPKLTPFERGRAFDIKDIIERGIDPLTVTVNSGLGSHSYTYKDVANYCELSHQPFSLTVSLADLKG